MARRRAGSGRKVNVQWDSMYVRLIDPRTGQLLRGPSIWGRSVADIASAMRIAPSAHRSIRTSNCWRGLHKAGAHIGAVCDAIHHRQAEAGVRRILGMLSLVEKYGSAACDQACAAALELGVSEYQFVRRYLERSPQAPLSLLQINPSYPRTDSVSRPDPTARIHFEEPNP